MAQAYDDWGVGGYTSSLLRLQRNTCLCAVIPRRAAYSDDERARGLGDESAVDVELLSSEY